MRIELFTLFFLCILSACVNKRENTYEENFAICSKKTEQISKKSDAELQFEENTFECMKGSIGPDFIAKTFRGDSISTKPAGGKAMVLYFWFITEDAPPEFARSDAEDFEAVNTLYHQFYKSIDFIGFPFNDSISAKHYLLQHHLDFPQVNDEKIGGKQLYLTQGHNPFIIFINTKGRIVKIFSGSYRRKKLIIEKYTPIIQACINNTAYTK